MYPCTCVPRCSDVYAHVSLILCNSRCICTCATLRVHVCVHCISLCVYHFYVCATICVHSCAHESDCVCVVCVSVLCEQEQEGHWLNEHRITDSLLPGKKKPIFLSPLYISLCVWVLILFYNDHVVFLQI